MPYPKTLPSVHSNALGLMLAVLLFLTLLATLTVLRMHISLRERVATLERDYKEMSVVLACVTGTVEACDELEYGNGK